jgi:hypothetical protein
VWLGFGRRLFGSLSMFQKFSFCLWLAALNRLPTFDRLRRWGDNYDRVCLLCEEDLEDRNHLFFS